MQAEPRATSIFGILHTPLWSFTTSLHTKATIRALTEGVVSTSCCSGLAISLAAAVFDVGSNTLAGDDTLAYTYGGRDLGHPKSLRVWP